MATPIENAPKTGATVRHAWPVFLVLFILAGGVGAGISWGFLSESLAALGIPDPGPITTAGLPFLRATAWFLAALAMGSFMMSAFFLTPSEAPGSKPSEAPVLKQSEAPAAKNTPNRHPLLARTLTVDGHIAASTGAYAALGFAIIGIVMVPLVLSDVSGQAFIGALRNWSLAINKVPLASVWLISSAIALLVALLALLVRWWRIQPVLFGLSFLMVLPLGLEGHSAAGGDHDYGTNSLLWHLLFMMLWIGGLLGLVAHGRRLGPEMAQAVHRYSHVALWAVVVMSISGVINAAIRVRVSDLFTTDYGLLIFAKAIGTIILAGFGWYHRARTIPQLADTTLAQPLRQRLFLRVAIAELAVMAAITGVAVSLGRTPPPPPRYIDLSPMALEMGYNLTKEPTFWNVWTVWRLDIMFTTFALLITAMYIRGLIRLRRMGQPWPWHRTFWFLLGSIGMALAMSSGVGLYMPAMFSMHMVAHMVLSMVIPVFLVLGAPLTLAMQTAPEHWCNWIEAFLASRTLRVLMHPAVNTLQFITIFYMLYITPWYDLMVKEHAGHLIMNWVFLCSGYLYYWDMIGTDPKPRENTVLRRLGWLVFSMPFHLYFGVYLMQLSSILAEDFYSTLALPWDIDLLHDQKVGGGIAWASGSFPLIVVFGALFREWLREDRKQERAYEEAAAADHEAELEAYNAMLEQMSRSGRNPNQ